MCQDELLLTSREESLEREYVDRVMGTWMIPMSQLRLVVRLSAYSPGSRGGGVSEVDVWRGDYGGGAVVIRK